MKAEIRLEEHDGPKSRDKIAALYAAVYPPEVLETVVWGNITSAKAELRIIAVDANHTAVAAAGLIFRNALADDRPVRVGGIGGVMTHPPCRTGDWAGLLCCALRKCLCAIVRYRSDCYSVNQKTLRFMKG